MFIWWRICWTVVTPVLILTFAIWSWVEAGPITTGDYTFPEWSNILGQMLSCSSLLGIFGGISSYIFKKELNSLLYEKFNFLIKKKVGWFMN